MEYIAVEPDEPVRPPPGLRYVYPTAQTNLWNTECTMVYQPTASGRVESALYGSVRTGRRLQPTFHEGIDIAALRRDHRNRPLDEIYAIADGRVAYINAIAGNSSYGIYVVVAHDDPVGEIYSLYSHMASVAPGLKAGNPITAGTPVGVMGNTSTLGIPMSRAHLHLEIGIIKNQRFHHWYRAQKLKPDHGRWHGHNLTGIDPLAVWGEKDASELHFSMLDYLQQLSPAFTLLFRTDRTLDYFKRYPELWQGPPFETGGIVMRVSEGGVPLSGRAATDDELAQQGSRKVQVLEVDETVLGRNGRRLVVRRQNQWEFGQNGTRWLNILMY